MNRLVLNAASLLLNMDTNRAELYNSVVCKFVGGKRVNFSRRGSYNMRCEAAAISFNTQDYYNIMEEAITHKKTSNLKRKHSLKINKKRLYFKDYMKHKYRKPKKIEPADQDYGPKSNPDPDMDEQILLEKKKEILIKLQLKEEEIVKLEVETRGQSTNCKWLEERAHRLTASYFGRVCKMRLTTSCENIVNDILYKQFLGKPIKRYTSCI